MQEKLRTPKALKILLLALVSLSLTSLSCKSTDDRQGFSPTIYAGDSETGSVMRDQANEVISCDNKKFDEMFCMYDRDLENLYKRCLSQVERERSWFYFGDKKAGKLPRVKAHSTAKLVVEGKKLSLSPKR